MGHDARAEICLATIARLDADAIASFDWACGRLASMEVEALASAIAREGSLDPLWLACDAMLDEPQRLALDAGCAMPEGHVHADWLIDLLRQATALPPRAGVDVAPSHEADAIDVLLEAGLLRPVDPTAERDALGASHRRWRDARIEARPARAKTVGNAVQLYLRHRAWPTPKNRARPFSPRELPSLVAVVAVLAANGAPLTASSIANAISERVRKTRGAAVAEAMHRPLVHPPLLPDDGVATVTHCLGLENLQCALRELRRFADAEHAAGRAIAIQRRLKGGADSAAESMLLAWTALLASDQGRHAEAESTMWSAIAMRRQFVDENNRGFATQFTLLAEIYHRQKKRAQAANAAARSFAVLKANDVPPAELASHAAFLAFHRRAAGDLAGAAKAGDEAVERSLDALRDDDPIVAHRLIGQAKTALRQRDFATALASLDRAAAIHAARPEITVLQRAIVANDSAVAHLGLNHVALAMDCVERAIALHASRSPPDARLLAVAYMNRSGVQRDAGDPAAARASLDEAERWVATLPADDSLHATLSGRRRRFG